MQTGLVTKGNNYWHCLYCIPADVGPSKMGPNLNGKGLHSKGTTISESDIYALRVENCLLNTLPLKIFACTQELSFPRK